MRWLFVPLLLGGMSPQLVGEDRPDFLPPKQVSVLPVFLVPRGGPEPSQPERALLKKHVEWARARYREMLGDRDTFAVAFDEPAVVPLAKPLAAYRALPKADAAPAWTAELLDHFETTRFACPYVFLAVVVNDRDRFPVGGGRPLNGGIGTGGGILVVSSHAMTRLPNFQSTLQHEIGHAFGLPHVDVYGYDMKTNPSIMSYNPAHHTNGLRPSANPGVLIPEDLRALALNDRVFPKLEFDARRDIPRGYSIKPKIVTLGPMSIPGHPDYAIEVETDGGEDFGSSISNVVVGRIPANAGPGVTYDGKSMWHSKVLPNGRTTIELRFPVPVELTSVTVHSQHSGRSHPATAGAVWAKSGREWKPLVQAAFESVEATLTFDATTAKEWRLQLAAGPSRRVVVRGLQFHRGMDEVFPQLVPPR